MLYEETADFLTGRILSKLNEGKKVLWLATGGSSIAVGAAASKILRAHPHQNLTVSLTDERYGEIGHPDSNWQKLINAGFELPSARLVPVLINQDMETTAENFDKFLGENFDYRIGLFGIGADGHTAGILPGSPAIDSEKLAISYHTEAFDRITMTAKAITMLDEAVIFMKGPEKWKALEDMEREIDLASQPAQILKKVPLLKIFSDKR